MNTHDNYIGGEWLAGMRTSPNINPSNTADVIGEYAQADAAQLDAAVRAAQAAFPAWATSGIQARCDALDKIGIEILARREELGTLLAREEGKVKSEAIGEVVRAGNIFKFGSSGNRVGSLKGKTWLRGAWLLGFLQFNSALKRASCLDGQFNETTAAAVGHVCVRRLATTTRSVRSLRRSEGPCRHAC